MTPCCMIYTGIINYFCPKETRMKNAYFLFLFFTILSCNAQPDSAIKTNPAGFEKGLSGNGIQILDVRTDAEFKTGHIKNALLADWNNQAQFLDRVKYIDKDKPVYIYCLAGGRSAAAARWMRENDFKTVIELEGGINAWKKESKPLEDNRNQPQMSTEQYEAKISGNKITLVDFGAAWCPPCVKMAPLIDELEKMTDLNVTIVKIDAGIHTDVMKQLNIGPIPVFIIYKKGKEVWRKEGIVTKEEFLAQLNQ